jgi:mannosyl-3-phosphoglycerate phosphatase family protein
MKKLIVFTDLDGTLLDYPHYSFQDALPALDLLREKDVPLVISSSKTRKEIEYYRVRLANTQPFISENGGGIFIPTGYFDGCVISSASISEEDGYEVIRLGADYFHLRNALDNLRKEGFTVKGFGDMTVEEVAEIAHMSIDEAEMAKLRDFDEPFLFDGNDEEIARLTESIRAKGFSVTQGRFFHILGNSDKGKAVSILSKLYREKFGQILTVAIGDSPNDVAMLEKVDIPVIVQKPNGTYDKGIAVDTLMRAEGIGPYGWNKAVARIVRMYA